MNTKKTKRKKKGGASFVNNNIIPTIKVIKGSDEAIPGHTATEYCNTMKLYYNEFIYKKMVLISHFCDVHVAF